MFCRRKHDYPLVLARVALALAADCLAGAQLAVACVLALGSVSDRMEKGLASRAGSLWRGQGAGKLPPRAAGLD